MNLSLQGSGGGWSESILAGLAAVCCAGWICVSPAVMYGVDDGQTTTEKNRHRLELSAGPMVGWRHFRAEQNGRNELYLDSPLFGGMLEATYSLTRGEKRRWSVFMAAGGSYAPIRWSFAGTGATADHVSGHHATARMDGVIRYRFLHGLAGELRAGIGGLSEWTEANPYYTGSRYLGGRIHAGLVTQPSERLEVEVSSGVLLSPWVEFAGGSRGEAPWALGWSGAGSCSWTLTRRLTVVLDYRLMGYQVAWESNGSPPYRTLDIHQRLGVRLTGSL